MTKNWQSFSPCEACGTTGPQRTYHHVLTRKAYPEHQKKPWNLISVCQGCHNLFHLKGNNHMASEYPNVKKWFIENGWEYCTLRKKWINALPENEGASI